MLALSISSMLSQLFFYGGDMQDFCLLEVHHVSLHMNNLIHQHALAYEEDDT